MMEPAHAFRLSYLPAVLSVPYAGREVLAAVARAGDPAPALRARITELARAFEAASLGSGATLDELEALLAAYGLPVIPRPSSAETCGAWMRTISVQLTAYLERGTPEVAASLRGYRLGELVVAMDLVATGRALSETAASATISDTLELLEGRLSRAVEGCRRVLRGGALAGFLANRLAVLPEAGAEAMRDHRKVIATALEDAMAETRSAGRTASLEDSPLDAYHLGFLPWSVAVVPNGRFLVADAGHSEGTIAAALEAGFRAAEPGRLEGIVFVETLLSKHGRKAPRRPQASGDHDRWAERVRASIHAAVCGTTPGGAAFRAGGLFGEGYLCMTLGLVVSLLLEAVAARGLYEHSRLLARRIRQSVARLEQAARHPALSEAAGAVLDDLCLAIRTAPELDGDEPAHVRVLALQKVLATLTAGRERLAGAL